MQPLPPAIFWRRRAWRTVLRYNLGCVLGAFLPVFLGFSALFACALLVVREQGVAGRGFWAVYAAGAGACLLFATRHVRARFFTFDDALGRLDLHGGLHNRLSAAAAGVGAFPAARPVTDGYTFRWGRIIAPAAGAIALVWAAAVLPLSGRGGAAFVPAVPPVAWTQAAQWVDALQKSDLLQDSALAEVRDRLELLRQQPARDWYSQSSLEAGDSLRDQTAQAIDSLQRDLRTAAGDVEAMQRSTDQTSAAETQGVRENLDHALKGLELGNLPLNRDLLNQLKELDLSKVRTLTPAQLEALQRQLRDGAKVCAACLGEGDADARLKAASLAATRTARGQPGPGGGGPAPLSLNEKPTDLGTAAKDSVSNPDLEHALPGDVIAVAKGEHTVDPTKYTGPVAGGAIVSPGEGGEAVWRDDLTPHEREVLRSFFK